MRLNYREQANHLAVQLLPENKQYFEKVSSYLSLSSLLLNEDKLNEQIYQLASDLLEAQNHGETASQFFGESPREIADEIIRQLPPSSWRERLKLLGECVIFFLVFQIAGDFNGVDKFIQINPLRYLVNTLVMLLAIVLIISSLKRMVYARSKVGRGLYMTFSVLVPVGFIAWTLLTLNFFDKQLGMELGYPSDLISLGSLLVGLLILYVLRKNKEPLISLILAILMTAENLITRALLHFSSLSEAHLMIIEFVMLLLVWGWFIYYSMKRLKE